MYYWRPRVVTISSRYVLWVLGNPQQIQTRNPKVLLAPQSGCNFKKMNLESVSETTTKPSIWHKCIVGAPEWWQFPQDKCWECRGIYSKSKHVLQKSYWRPRVVAISRKWVLRMFRKPQHNKAFGTNVLLAPQSGDNFLKISFERARGSTANPNTLSKSPIGAPEWLQFPENAPWKCFGNDGKTTHLTQMCYWRPRMATISSR